MKRKPRLFIIPLLLIMAIGFVGCNGHDDDNNEVSCISWTKAVSHEYFEEIVEKRTLPIWLQQIIDSKDIPLPFRVLKAQNDDQIVYILNTYDSHSIWDYRDEDGNEWRGDYCSFYDIVLIFAKDLSNNY